MNKWYLCTVAYERQGDEMGLRKVSESYLVDALTFTEAEERIIKEVTLRFVRGARSGEHPTDEIGRYADQ